MTGGGGGGSGRGSLSDHSAKQGNAPTGGGWMNWTSLRGPDGDRHYGQGKSQAEADARANSSFRDSHRSK